LRRGHLPATLEPVSDEVELAIAWASLGPATKRSREIFDDLVGRYRQPHRRYHGLRHVVWVLRHSRRLEDAIPACADPANRYDAEVVTAAAWFHDAIYDPRAGDNEERSASLADQRLASLGWEPQRCALVAELVTATAGHLADPDAADGSGAPDGSGDGGRPGLLERGILLDADLAVLGAEPAAYAAYVNGVRSEYGHLPEAEWTAGRARLVERLLGRRRLFATEPAAAWWGERAQANLAAELAGLAR
jgi:predicted metal-dependent HD superfamily phosphohydrolase